MTGRYVAILSLSLLASCGTLGERLGGFNPFSFIGGSDEVPEEAEERAGFVIPQIDDGKSDIPVVTSARLEYTPSGVIVRANGEAPSLGYHSASLRPMNFGKPDGNGAIWYQFRVVPPAIKQQSGSSFARTLSVGNFIPNSRLRTVQSVTITGAQNDVTIRLR